MNVRTIRLAGREHVILRRDSQRSRLYTAERAAFGPAFREVISDGELHDVERFVRRVEASKTWAKLLAESGVRPTRVNVADGRGRRSACALGSYEIRLPRWTRTAPYILHELAHVARPRVEHHWPFAEAYIRLVSRFVGVEAAARLKAAFREAGVRYRPKKTYPPEVREKLRRRGLALAASRQNPQQETVR